MDSDLVARLEKSRAAFEAAENQIFAELEAHGKAVKEARKVIKERGAQRDKLILELLAMGFPPAKIAPRAGVVLSYINYVVAREEKRAMNT